MEIVCLDMFCNDGFTLWTRAATVIACFQFFRSRRHLETLMVISAHFVNVVTSSPTFRHFHVQLCINLPAHVFGLFTSRGPPTHQSFYGAGQCMLSSIHFFCVKCRCHMSVDAAEWKRFASFTSSSDHEDAVEDVEQIILFIPAMTDLDRDDLAQLDGLVHHGAASSSRL